MQQNCQQPLNGVIRDVSQSDIIVALATGTNTNGVQIGKELILAKSNDLELSKNNSEKLLWEGTRSGNEQLEAVGYGQVEKFSAKINVGKRGATRDGDKRDGQRDQVSMVVASLGESVGEEQAILVEDSVINQALVALPVLKDFGQREKQSENVADRKLVQDSNWTVATRELSRSIDSPIRNTM
ncbi:hypothetical protein FXO37_10053 [Capsicum annuum]|nr:hypothetical protein FXO37_10053 [Capsicum annuum]